MKVTKQNAEIVNAFLDILNEEDEILDIVSITSDSAAVLYYDFEESTYNIDKLELEKGKWCLEGFAQDFQDEYEANEMFTELYR